MKFTSDITVQLVQRVGSDVMIAHAAWVSPPERLPVPGKLRDVLVDGKVMCIADMGLLPPDKNGLCKPVTEDRVRALLSTLIEKRHGTPFEHGSLTAFVNGPSKIWWEWVRHRIGHSYNLESSRYHDMEPLFYVPPRERSMIRPEGFKSMRPAFDRATDEEYDAAVKLLQEGYHEEWDQYQGLLKLGVDRGLAMMVLGQGVYFRGWVTVNPRSLMAFLELRTEVLEAKRPSHPLYEIRVAAEKMEALFAAHWPITHELWVKYGRMAP